MTNQPLAENVSDPHNPESAFYQKTVVSLSATDGISADFSQTLLHLDAAMFSQVAHADGILRREIWPSGLTRENVLQAAERIWRVFPECLNRFLTAFQAALPVLSKKEISEWIECAWRFQKAFPQAPQFCGAYFESSPIFFSERRFGNLDIWVDEALRIADYSLNVACQYVALTPGFVESDSLLHLKEWGGRIRDILTADAALEVAASGFIKTSIELLQAISYRIFQNWCATGTQLLHKSHPMAQQFYASLPHGMLSLYQTEMRKVFDLTTLVAKELPGKAIELYQTAAIALLHLNPNVREKVLDITRKNAQGHPERVQGIFNAIIAGIQKLSYPDQEIVIDSEAAVGKISVQASHVYFDNAALLLQSVRTSFFPFWVEEGCSRLRQSEKSGLDYFGFDSADSQDRLAKWKEAIFLEECEKSLAVFARALCGRGIRLKPLEPHEAEPADKFRQSPEDGGDMLYLPTYIADEATAADNFRQYKVATAH
ncbi:MAG: hypothetical protein HQ517_12205, partial [SAR324 cluster bacterium]|nr:hypothetical protein [SAR324 cluster bacterium]